MHFFIQYSGSYQQLVYWELSPPLLVLLRELSNFHFWSLVFFWFCLSFTFPFLLRIVETCNGLCLFDTTISKGFKKKKRKNFGERFKTCWRKGRNLMNLIWGHLKRQSVKYLFPPKIITEAYKYGYCFWTKWILVQCSMQFFLDKFLSIHSKVLCL